MKEDSLWNTSRGVEHCALRPNAAAAYLHCNEYGSSSPRGGGGSVIESQGWPRHLVFGAKDSEHDNAVALKRQLELRLAR